MRAALLALALGWAALPLQAQAPAPPGACREALALALDVSGSVDGREYRQQLDGLAAALTDPEVQDAFLALPDAPVDLAIYEWSGPGTARPLLPWTTVGNAATLAGIADALRRTLRAPADPSTALGAALLHGGGLLGQRAGCWRRVLDVSGDGKSNTGPRPQDVQDAPALAGVTVNGLVVGAAPGNEGPGGQVGLEGYFRAWVIRGPEAFVERAEGYADYRDAMKRKLIRELQVLAVSDAR